MASPKAMSIPPSRPGFVSFVSAGPGSPDLLTLRAESLLKSAEVVLYDALLEEGMQKLFPNEAECVYVGKRSGAHSKTQEEINELLVHYGKQGKQIVRLKGGDASVFGRLGEEIQILRSHNIPFQIIPGVSSVTAGISELNSSLTLRGVSRQILIIDGHSIVEDPKSASYLSSFPGTLVILMASQKVEIVASILLELGYKKETPIGLVEKAGSSSSQMQISTLGEAKEYGLKLSTDGPGILYLGETLRETYNLYQEHAKTISNLP
ncbi:uroporphyrin-III C-methyltransferase [Leptospira ryugenii]|uniref:uroporphyrinogen-III C-methyltransferase n=1 Tax=Leptospira ryugenii TaxID=1917863 RepID=A0A2P2DVE8_9LEPT|nr:uroporphyrinogen-III C-methyltransferase [Leptospira ryugenii]GBF48616.1 uroporphyrin-III C-methyltransferase [Leptospira ryugenii]